VSSIKLRQCVALVGFAALWICGNVHATQVRAWLDRNTMQLGETVTLNVEVGDDASAGQPDFSALQSDFNLLGTQSSTAMNIINGQASSKLLWAVGLEPKHAGAIVIPAINVAGTQTQPISLTVQPANGNGGKAGDDVFLQVAVEPRSPYVQQQARATVKLFYALNLTDGNLEDPHGDGINARKLGQDTSYTADVDGRRYKVLERHYALSAEKSGALTLAPVSFRGHALNPNDLNSFFSRGRAVTAQAPATTLDVRARPQASGSDAWLPAQSLDLTADGIDATTEARVGEPITLTLRVKAQGLAFEQLPELKLPKIDGADVYPDKETTQNRDDGTWQYGERERKFAIVPNRPGTLTIPALSLSWWNTAQDRAATAELPAHTLNAAASTGADTHGADAKPSAIATANPNGVASGAPPATFAVDASSAAWRMLAIAGFVLWLATLAAWIYTNRRARASTSAARSDVAAAVAEDMSIRTARKAFTDACARDDASASARSLLAWARAQGSSARTLGELAAKLSDAGQRDALRTLERTIYGVESAAGGSGARLAAAFSQGISLPSIAVANTQSSLPPLYPFEVRKNGTTGR
jgi:hypothetical protein